MRSFGVRFRDPPSNALDRAFEEVRVQGYAILDGIIPPAELPRWRERLDAVYARQEAETGRDDMQGLNELDTARALVAYDDHFAELAAQPTVLALVRRLVAQYVILSQQNGVLCHANRVHHQTAWHRDLPYQEVVTSRPLAVSAIFALDEFSQESGATWVVPASHKQEVGPSTDYIERHRVPAVAAAGSVILLDSLLLHCTGLNTAGFIRRAVINLYTVPLLAQQINLPRALQGRLSDRPELRQLLGYDAEPGESVLQWRTRRLTRPNTTGGY
jgi:ectoine hydroxylase-related dioxygenase (phytanoyl-CoA dioxygenase family)